jgi:hypothetical protein
MIELVLIACLSKQPEHCEQYYVPTEPRLTMIECVVSGQIQLVQWHQDHPDWVIRRWICGPPRA